MQWSCNGKKTNTSGRQQPPKKQLNTKKQQKCLQQINSVHLISFSYPPKPIWTSRVSKEDKEAACEGKKSEKGETEEAPSHRSSKKETCGQKAFIKKLALEKKIKSKKKNCEDSLRTTNWKRFEDFFFFFFSQVMKYQGKQETNTGSLCWLQRIYLGVLKRPP